ncbi:hypothetical protein [Clostridium tyrobutyricum]|uniref:hypothetical protein n=1 Tax=Clostridium tyrobutyricum TaxID=1519 RepID=UPI00057C8893|nr:hypothetical protein [Clostridium tyrobutyricum]
MVYFILICVLVCIIGSIRAISKTKAKMMQSGNEMINEFINKNNISMTKAINIPGYNGSGKFIIDDVNKFVHYFVYTKGNSNLFHKQFSYKDILKCELIKDGRIALVKDVFSIIDMANKKEYIKKFGIRITFNDLDFPYLDVYFIKSSVGVTLTGLGDKVSLTNEWLSSMNIIIDRGKAMA